MVEAEVSCPKIGFILTNVSLPLDYAWHLCKQTEKDLDSWNFVLEVRIEGETPHKANILK
jgi:hypothetical protein